jgi:hypothetical protein
MVEDAEALFVGPGSKSVGEYFDWVSMLEAHVPRGTVCDAQAHHAETDGADFGAILRQLASRELVRGRHVRLDGFRFLESRMGTVSGAKLYGFVAFHHSRRGWRLVFILIYGFEYDAG